MEENKELENDGAIYIQVYPSEVTLSRRSGCEMLGSASMFLESYSNLASAGILMQQGDEDITEEIIGSMGDNFVATGCVTIQWVVSIMAAILGENANQAIINGMEMINAQRKEQENADGDGADEDGADA